MNSTLDRLDFYENKKICHLACKCYTNCLLRCILKIQFRVFYCFFYIIRYSEYRIWSDFACMQMY